MLSPKWNPNAHAQVAGEETADQNDPEGANRTPFNKYLELNGTLGDAFRIFTEGGPPKDIPKLRNNDGTPQTITVNIAAKAKELDNHKMLAYGVAFPNGNTLAKKLLTTELSKNALGELFAINEAAQKANSQCKLNIETSSKEVIRILTKDLVKIENQGFLLTPNGKELQATVAELRARKQETTLLLRNPGQTNESREAIKLACETLDNPNISTHNLLKNPEMMLTGAKLNTLSQATAYKMLRVLKMRKYVKRKKTINMINLTKENVHGRHGIKLLEKDIWKGIRQKDLAKTTQNFLWMAIHDAYMIGNNWLRPEYAAEYQRRSECQTCIQIETMDHILTDCTATGQSEI